MLFTLGGTHHERIAIEVRGYSYPSATDATDKNWLNSKVSVAVGGFRGSVECALRTEDLSQLEAGLEALTRDPRAEMSFATLEQQLSFKVTGNGLGQCTCSGAVTDQPGIGNRLHWEIEVDGSQLAGALAEAQALKAAFPPRS